MRPRTLLLVATVPLVCALVGYAGGPVLARAHRTVQLAARVWQEDTQHLPDRTLETEAFRATGRPVADLMAEARAIEQRFRVGGALLGVWCGLVVVLKCLGLAAPRPRSEYDIDHAQCLSCARCFLSCPRERLRLKKQLQPASAQPTSPPPKQTVEA